MISEILEANKNGLTDENGDYSDWIEIYNPGLRPVNLSGWSLTDDRDQLQKWAFPDIVLGKLGKLNDDEHTLIKIHPERGYDILQDVERLKPALPGIRHHHERFDGEGYPKGLLGKSIP